MSSKILKGTGKIYMNGELIGTFTGVNMSIGNDKTIIIVDDLKKTESSNVANVAYQESSKKTFVTFSNGGLYEYRNVEKEDFEALRDAESVGRHLRNVFLKKGFEYEKLIDTELSYPVLTAEVLEEAAKKAEEGFGKA